MGKRRKEVVSTPSRANREKRVTSDSWMLLAGILLVTFVVFSPALRNGITYIDDDMYVLKNPFIRAINLHNIGHIFSSFYEYNYHPLTLLSYMLEYRMFGLDPAMYHITSLLLHLANVALVYRLVSSLSGQTTTAIVTSVLFAIHPMHVETVAWVAERKGLLSTLFCLLALRQYLLYISAGQKRSVYVNTLLFFIAALLSKPAAVTLPLLMMAIDWYKGRKWQGRVIIEKIPFFLLSVVLGILTIMAQQAGGALGGVGDAYSIVDRIFLFTGGLAFYFVRLVVPYPLAAIHYFPDLHKGMLPLPFYLSPLVLVAVGWLAWKSGRLRREVVFGLAFFLLAISVMLQVVSVGGAYAAERYSYFSYIGLFYIIGQGLSALSPQMVEKMLWPLLGCAAVLAIASFSRAKVWADTDTVFDDIIAKNPGNSRNCLVYFHWADARRDEGRLTDAIAMYDKALAISPGYTEALMKRGGLHEYMHNYKAALADYTAAIRQQPANALPYNYVGWLLHLEGKDSLAIAYIDTAVKRNDKYASAFNNRGWIRFGLKDSSGALADFNKSVEANPGFTKAYFNRAIIRVGMGQLDQAIKDYSTVIALDPADARAYYDRGLCYVKRGQTILALHDFEKAAHLGYADAETAISAVKAGRL